MGMRVSYDLGALTYDARQLDQAVMGLFAELDTSISLTGVSVHFVDADTFDCDGMEVYGCAFEWSAALVAARDSCLARTAFVHEMVRLIALEDAGHWGRSLPDKYFEARNSVNHAIMSSCQ